MSSDVFVRTRGLGKRFRLYDTPWARLADTLLRTERGREHWALRNVDLDLRVGESVGIVGRNGAGKSTLLEMICGILQPSEGTVETSGRIAALLQLGAGFNPEFTGRENVFLGASLYGLSAAEVERRMAAIEEFAGIGDFIDRPVRDYSSGMYARLAFSVCAHVDADILVVDEILGVGDVTFQQKSMRFMRAFRKRGIVLFVSHNEHAVSALCSRAIWIDRGSVAASGRTADVLYLYRREMSRLMGPQDGFEASGAAAADDAAPVAAGQALVSAGSTDADFDPDDPPRALGGGEIGVVALTLPDGSAAHSAIGGEALTLSVACSMTEPDNRPYLLFTLRNPMGQVVFAGDTRQSGAPQTAADGQDFSWEFGFVLPFLPTGNYPFDLFLLSETGGAPVCLDRRDAAAVIQVLSQHVSSGMANVAMDRSLLLVGAEAP